MLRVHPLIEKQLPHFRDFSRVSSQKGETTISDHRCIFMECQYCKTEHNFSYCPKCGKFEGKKNPESYSDDDIKALMHKLSEFNQKNLFTIEVAYLLSCCMDAFKNTKENEDKKSISYLKKQFQIYKERYELSFDKVLEGFSYTEQKLSSERFKKNDDSNEIPGEQIGNGKKEKIGLDKRKNKKRKKIFPIDEDSVSFDSLMGYDLNESSCENISKKESSQAPLDKSMERQIEVEEDDEEISIDNISVDPSAGPVIDLTGVLIDEELEEVKTKEPNAAVASVSWESNETPNVSGKSEYDLPPENISFEEVVIENTSGIESKEKPKKVKNLNEKKARKEKKKRKVKKDKKKGLEKDGSKKKNGKRKIVIIDPESDFNYDGYYDDVKVIGDVEKSSAQIVMSENSKTLIVLGVALLIGLGFIIYGISSIF